MTASYQPPAHGFRTFGIVWGTQSVSVIGTQLTFFAMTIWLTQVLYPRPEDKPELALALSAVGLSFSIPTMLMVPFAGAWADRHDRKLTMFVTDFAAGVMSLILASLIITRVLQLWMLILIIIVDAAIGAFHQSAFDTAYAMLVPEKQLPRANGMMQTTWALSGIIAPALAAAIISLPALSRQGFITGALGAWLAQFSEGAPLAITLDALTFFVASSTLLFLYVPSPKRADLKKESGSRSIWADIQEGARYIWHRRPMIWLLATFAVANLMTAPILTLQPLYVKFNLADDWAALGMTFETALASLGSLASVGGLVGGVLIMSWGGLKKRRVYGILLPMMVSGITLTILGLSSAVYVALAMAFITFACSPVINAHSQAIWQTQTPRELQGRVFAVRRVIAQFTAPLGTVIGGATGGLFNPGLVIAVCGGILALFCIAQLFNPFLLRVEDKVYLDAMAARAELA